MSSELEKILISKIALDLKDVDNITGYQKLYMAIRYTLTRDNGMDPQVRRYGAWGVGTR